MLQYLKRIITFELEYSFDIELYKIFYSGPSLVGYADSNYAGNIKNK